MTPYGAFVEAAPLTHMDVVLVTAASSGVGLGAIQVSKLMGATVIAHNRTSAKSKALEDVGADHVVITDEQDLTVEVNRVTKGAGATAIFDPVGGPNFPKLVAAGGGR